MKIGVYAPFYHPFEGGAERVARRVSHLLSANHEVTVFTLQYDQSLPLIEHDNDIIVRRFPYKAMYPLGLTKTNAPQLLKTLQTADIDILHIHGVVFTDVMLNVVKVMNARQIPTVLIPHGLFEAFYGDTKLASWRRNLSVFFVRLFLRLLLRTISHIALTSPEEKKILQYFQFPVEKTTVVYNGFEPPDRDMASASRFRQQHQLGSDIVLLQVASVKPNKGHDLVVEALKQIKDKVPNVHYVAVGNKSGLWGEYAQKVEKLAHQSGVGQRVALLGHISDEELVDAYAATDIVLLPSLAETFPLSVLDGMAWGKAVIATDVGGVSHMITNDKDGYLIPANDIPILAESILTLACSPDERARLGQAAQKTVSKFSWDQVIARYEQISQQLIGED
ncbi:MAG TPA: glycosyltransferase family 4 protein [Anaerolineae bacterium]|nr:glycosyltransferase family 4 protein [Anaerolineae bacterium]